MTEVSNLLLFIALLFLTGYHLLDVIPDQRRPRIHVSKRVLLVMTFLVPLALLVPVTKVVTVLVQQFQVGWFEAIYTVFLTYSAGQAAFYSLLIASILVVLTLKTSEELPLIICKFILVLLLIGLSGWASHAASLTGISGFLSNSIHLLATSLWIGPLLMVAWFAKHPMENPAAFAAWYSPLAALSVGAITLTGFLLMGNIVPEYVNSWMITYGQLLVIKHILFVPLLLFGFRHSLLLRRIKKHGHARSMKSSFRMESVIAVFILAVTAFMTEQTPPHEVIQTLQTEQISPLIQLFLNQPILVNQTLQFDLNTSSSILLVAGLFLFIGGMFILLQSHKVWGGLAGFLIASILVYSGLMVSATPEDTVIDDTVYETDYDAIKASYSEETEIAILKQEELESNRQMVVYTVNDSDLVAQMIEVTSDGFKRLPASMLTIGGTAITDEEQKIRTFRVQNGNWHHDAYDYTYVTFGMIRQPEDVARVQIHYEGGSYIAELEANVFINTTSSNELWNDQHPIDFLSDDGTVIETYAREVMEEGVYCH
ncbi:copper resistance D family protein [Alkalihalophilus lindianensis]|uniref:Copper resistance D family protein n=1 Tax=Alkalihalophilus lindianensis TaxID=1630542 RepID=A0ABU3X7Q5_9BACI|nr:copper resistance D family protein [Alkalihalophilus lindianensis]MDV2683926.1 copper resistance D family protein [Alkalihalophilus lindianensis]